LQGLHYLYYSEGQKSIWTTIPSFTRETQIILQYTLLYTVILCDSSPCTSRENSENKFANELQSNGIYRFILAFMDSEAGLFLSYKETMPVEHILLSGLLKTAQRHRQLS
jgi:hypothetical protein